LSPDLAWKKFIFIINVLCAILPRVIPKQYNPAPDLHRRRIDVNLSHGRSAS